MIRTKRRSNSPTPNMIPVVAGTPDSAASLAKLQESINKLRRALNQCAVRKSQLEKSKQLNTKEAKGEFQALSQHLLSLAIAIKMAHESIITNVDNTRTKIRNDQEQLMKARLKLQNLEYEKRSLQREIRKCRATTSPLLLKTGVTIPPSLFDANEGDEAVTRNLKAANTALQDELVGRKRARDQLEATVAEVETKKRKLSDMRTSLRRVPDAVHAVTEAAEPVRRLVSPDRSGIASRAAQECIGRLPAPLYKLAREAIAFREAFDSRVEMRVVEEDDAGEIKEGLYTGCASVVVLEVGAEGVQQARLRVQFRYLDELGIVVVRAAVVIDGNECDEYPTKELQLLFPLDCGERSPRAGNVHLENGTFAFDVAKAGGRAFVWANVLCGITCVPEIAGMKGASGDDTAWVKEMWGMMSHIRFKEVVQALRKRLVTIVQLKEQVDSLMAKRTCVRGVDIGLEGEPRARVEDFVKLGRGDWNPDGLVRDGGDSQDTEVWSMHVLGTTGLRVMCLVAIEADYPDGRPTFRIGCDKLLDGMRDLDVVELERGVNDFQVKGELSNRPEVLLGAQITALLTLVDRLEVACKASTSGEGVVNHPETQPHPGQGRSRPRRDLLTKR